MTTHRTKKPYPADAIAEIRQIREEIAAEYNYAIHEICAASMRRQKASGRPIVDRSRLSKATKLRTP